jgi:PHP family Zn ribbon phosphoesterase
VQGRQADRRRCVVQWVAVPWCVHCNKFLTPSTVRPDARCPVCGEVVERGLIPGMTRPADETPVGIPWHLKLLGLATALYLGFRFYQLIDWVLHR